MSPRAYNQKVRGEAAAETRQRIVEATYELHGSRGISATSFKDIAERADVAIGTVYHHFPTMDDILRACGAHTMRLTMPPGPQIFEGVASPRERLQMLILETFRFYDRFPEHDFIRSERRRFPYIDEVFREAEEGRRELIALAVRPRRPPKSVAATAFAVLEPAVHRAYIASGLTTEQAAREVFALLEPTIFRRTSK